MSLIDEALKRAQAAQGSEPRLKADRRPWTPAPLPDESRIRRRKLLRAAAITALIIAVSTGGLVLTRHITRTGLPVPADQAPGHPTAVPAPPAPLEEVRVAAPPRGVSAARSTPASAPAARPSTSDAPASASASGDRPTALANGKTYIESVTLPGGGRIELGGIVYSESNATALVNGKVVGPGAIVEGFLVQRIEENRVELANSSGLTIYLALK